MAKYQYNAEFERDIKKLHPELWQIDDIYTDIIASISVFREKLGLSQEELAEKCGLKQSAIARLEMCVNKPRIDTLLKVLFALGLRLTVEEEKTDNQLIDLEIWKKHKMDEYKWVNPEANEVIVDGLVVSYS